MKKIGIYAGTFDPVHAGHIAFATKALTQCRLDKVFLVPERTPRHKASATPYTMRVDTLRDKIADTPINILELPDEALTVSRTLPEIQQRFPSARLYMLVGSDVVTHMSTWPNIVDLVNSCAFIIGMRSQHNQESVMNTLLALGIERSSSTLISTEFADVSSSSIRSQLQI